MLLRYLERAATIFYHSHVHARWYLHGGLVPGARFTRAHSKQT
jgi:hypothetical protein